MRQATFFCILGEKVWEIVVDGQYISHNRGLYADFF